MISPPLRGSPQVMRTASLSPISTGAGFPGRTSPPRIFPHDKNTIATTPLCIRQCHIGCTCLPPPEDSSIAQNEMQIFYSERQNSSERLNGASQKAEQRKYELKELEIKQKNLSLELDMAKEGGFDWAWLGVWEHNVKAQGFYRKYGFEKFSEHSFKVGDKVDTNRLLRKALKE